ncbi:MAG: BatD family protein [Capnocytophaga felis]|nr:BatD family protein [Capnocytophaga felis]
MKNKILYALLLLVSGLKAQEIQFETDTKEIKIGEQIKYKISVEASEGEPVLFPDGQTFMPLEMVRTSPTDTITKGEKIRLEKEYFLTQFDAGNYTIPRQRISINSKDFYTDSLQIEVHSIAVDTLKQPLYDIKPIMEVTPPKSMNLWLWIGFVIAVIALALLIVYLVMFRKKQISETERIKNLPPFERAIEELKKLQESKYLIESKHKEYYSELTDIIRNYLEDEVHISAKESTSDELLEKIHLLQESGKLNLTLETISNLKRVLQTADLVKFAKSKPEDTIAEYDRETIKDVVVKTKSAIPEVSENIDNSNKQQIEIIQKKKHKKKKITNIVVAVIAAILAGALAYYLTYNFFGGNYIEKISKTEWVTSDYGYPITELSTPKILTRRQIIDIKGFDEQIKKQYVFDFGSINSELYIMTSVITFKQTSSDQNINLDPDMVNEIVLSQLDAAGAKNITTLKEEYTTPNGVQGIKVSGKMKLSDERNQKTFDANYELYSFTENGALQQLLITYVDTPQAKEIAQRVLLSINFKRD